MQKKYRNNQRGVMNKQQSISAAIIGLSLYLISTGLSFGVFSFFRPGTIKKGTDVPGIDSVVTDADGGFTVDPNLPKTESCPLNGVMYTEIEREAWEQRRPLSVMIENHVESRPQSGLSRADVVYEAVAEGGITRFFAVFYCDIAAKKTLVAPVRSARTYFLPWVLEYDALYNHVGGAGRCNDTTVDERAKALCQIETYGVKDMDQFSISFPTCYRNYDRLGHPVATEHTMVCDSYKLYELAKERGWTNVDEDGVSWDEDFTPWSFKDGEGGAQDQAVSPIEYVAWDGYEGSMGALWEYDSTSNVYKRSTGGSVHTDLETDEQLSASVVVVQFADEIGPVDDHLHLLYENIGTGDAIVFQDGKVTEGTWKKSTRSARTVFYDDNGEEMVFTRGRIWISMLPTGTDVSY